VKAIWLRAASRVEAMKVSLAAGHGRRIIPSR
jgi:hypothetical protein